MALLGVCAQAHAAGWSPAKRLVRDRGTDPVTMRPAVNDAGAAAFVWIKGPFGRAEMATEPRMAVGHDGTVAVAWIHPADLGAPSGQVEASIKPPGSGFSAPQALASGCIGTSPQVVVAPSGETIAAWQDSCDARPRLASAAASGQEFAMAEPLFTPPPGAKSFQFGFLDLAVMRSGTAVAAFSPDARVAVRRSAGPFGAAHLIATSSFATTPHVAAGGRLAIVAWQDRGGFSYSTLTGRSAAGR